MYELLLSAVVPDRHDQLLRILAGVSAMPPTLVTERHLIFKPVREIRNRSTVGFEQVGGSQGIAAVKSRSGAKDDGDLWYTQLVQTIEDGEKSSKWEWVMLEVPDAVRRPVTARQVDLLQLDQGDAMGWMEGIGYRWESTNALPSDTR